MYNYHEIFTSAGLMSILTLSVMEIVLGIDNIIFISIVANKLPKAEQKQARVIGLSLALIFRCALLFSISWIVSLREPMFFIGSWGISGRDLILFIGGVFLIVKTIKEIAEKFKTKEAQEKNLKTYTLSSAIAQIVFIDIVFSFDSILTAVGLVSNVLMMIAGVIIAMIAMLSFSGVISDFIDKHPTVKMLALVFLILIGIVLVLESFHIEFSKTYIYVALVFSLSVEVLNMTLRSYKIKQGFKENN